MSHKLNGLNKKSDNNLVAGQHDVVAVVPKTDFSRSLNGVCGSKRTLKFRLRNAILLFFFFPLSKLIKSYGRYVYLSQCCQQSNHRNILKELFFLISRIRNISHNSSSLKDGRGKSTIIYSSIHKFVDSFVVGSYPNSAASYHT